MLLQTYDTVADILSLALKLSLKHTICYGAGIWYVNGCS